MKSPRVGPETYEDQAYEDWKEWKDGDNDNIFHEGYEAGLQKAIETIELMRSMPGLNEIPAKIVMSGVTGTLRKIQDGGS